MEFAIGIIISMLSGIAGSMITLIVQNNNAQRKEREEFALLKQGLYLDCCNSLTSMESAFNAYKTLYRNNEYRVEESLLLDARSKLLSRFNDRKLLAVVINALADVSSLNHLLDLYRDECFRSSSRIDCAANPPAYLVEMNQAIWASIKNTIDALVKVAMLADPVNYAKRVKMLEAMGAR